MNRNGRGRLGKLMDGETDDLSEAPRAFEMVTQLPAALSWL